MNLYEVRKKFDDLAPWEWVILEAEDAHRTRNLYLNLHWLKSKWRKDMKVQLVKWKVKIMRVEEDVK